MHEVKINGTALRFPSEWNELTRHHLELIAGLCFGNLNLNEMRFKSFLLFYIAGIHVKEMDAFRDPESKSELLYQVSLADHSVAYLSPKQIVTIADGFDFIFERKEKDGEITSVSLDSKLTKNLIPRFKVRATHYYGPSDRLFNISFAEYIHAETNANRFLKDKDVTYLDKLIAVLYRPERSDVHPGSEEYNGDRRIKFNDHKIDERAEKISRINHNLKYAILLFYQGCQRWYHQQFPHVFSYKKGSKGDGLGFLGLVDALTDGDVTKNEKVRSSYLVDVMVHLERSAIEYEKQAERLKKK
jgi:hypothetical protein